MRICLPQQFVTMSAGTIEDGSAQVGGNVNAWSSSTLAITGGTIQNGTATERGGNVVTTGKAGSIQGATINGGEVSGTSKGGGSIFVGGSTTLTIDEGTTVTGGATQKGGAVYVESGTLNINDGTITGGGVDTEGALVSATGGNIYICANQTVNIIGGTISSGKATTGGNIYVPANANLNITGGTITGGGVNGEEVVTTHGGNVYCLGNLSIGGGTITGGKSSSQGGNIYYSNKTEDVALTMSAGTVSSGESARGGNIYINNNSVLNITGGYIKDGTASNGGNLSCWGESQLNISNAEITGGTAPTRGGSIESFGDITLTSGKISGGKTDKTGGNIYIAVYTNTDYPSTLTVNGGTIESGEAITGGGNVYANAQASIVMNGGLITAGTTEGAGGNIWTNGTVTMTQASADVETKITDGVADVGTSNTAGIGGNIYVDGGTINVTNATISGGESKLSRAGNIYMQNASTLNLNEGGVIAEGTSKLNGGNIMVNNATGVINVNGGTIRDGESTNAEGGNIRFGGATLTINSGTISGGKAKTNGGNIVLGADNSDEPSRKLIMNAGEITGGVAELGGSIYLYSGTTLNMIDGSISGGGINANNEIVTERGGNIYSDGTITMSAGKISDGKATALGGNIYTESTFTMEDGTISSGKVTGENSGGGNIYVTTQDASMVMKAGTIEKGTAVDKGGNICVWNRSALDIQGGTISGGVAEVRGGNICALGDVTMSAGTITGGIASRDAVEATEEAEAIEAAGRGGNIYIMPYGSTKQTDEAGNAIEKEYQDVTFNISGGTITLGVAKISGGNIYAAGLDQVDEYAYDEENTEELVLIAEKRNSAVVNMNLNGATITDGKAYDQGGNVHVNDYVPLTISGKNTITGGQRYVVAQDENTDGTTTEVTTEYASNLYLSGVTGTIAIGADFETESPIGISVAGGREGIVVTGVTDAYKDLFVLENIDNKEFTYDSENGTLSITLNEPLAYNFIPIWSGGTTSVPTGLTNFNNKWSQLHTYQASGTEATSNKRRLMSVAHRGDMVNYPENSAEAFQSAVALGADIVELDIHTTYDGELVLWHDSVSDTEGNVIGGKLNSNKSNIDEVLEKNPNLPKANPGSYMINDWTAEELRTYVRLKSNSKQTTYVIPTFEEVLSICKGKVFMMLDIRTEDTRSKVITLVESLNDSSVYKSILLNTLYSGLTVAQVKEKINTYSMPYMRNVTSVKFTEGVANITPAELGTLLSTATTYVDNNDLPKILRCGEYYEDYDSQYSNYKQNYRIFIETLTAANDNRETWKKLDNGGYGYSIIHTNDIEGLTDYIADTWYK